MSIPGENLLDIALSVIDSQEVLYYQFLSRATNAKGVWVTTYTSPAQDLFEGSVQPVNKSVYAERGLDFEKNYVSWFLPFVVATDLVRDSSGDVFEWAGRRFQLKGKTDWYQQDGWAELLGVDIGPATGAFTNA